MTVSVADLQAYLRRAAALQYETIALPGLTLYLHPSDDLTFFNYAIPDENGVADLDGSLAQMRAECAARCRRPRFEFIHECAPGLAATLRAAGFVEEACQPLMACTPDKFGTVLPVAGLEIDELDATASVDQIQTFLSVQHQGFDPNSTEAVDAGEARQFLSALGEGRAFVACQEGRPVSAGMYSAPLAVGQQGTWIAELTGLATLVPFRRRGIATALAARALQSAFKRGVDVVCLVAADERAGRVYERVGFRARATMLAWIDAQETGF